MNRLQAKKHVRVCIVVLAVLFSVPVGASAQEIRVAAAADLKFALSELATEFEKQSGAKVSATYGSSGNFFEQIRSGAPFDLFFSADLDYPRKLEAVGLTETGTLCEYARGRIVIWARADTPLDLAAQSWNALTDSAVQKIAVANPSHAPYGQAAVSALKKAGIYEQVKPKLVYGENISQAAQFVQSGNAQAGIIALSLAISPAMKDGKRWDIPADMYPPIAQGAVLLKGAQNKAEARAFLEFVKSIPARATLVKFGFMVPEADTPSAEKP